MSAPSSRKRKQAALPSDLPGFAAGLAESGELLAYLHLTGNHATNDHRASGRAATRSRLFCKEAMATTWETATAWEAGCLPLWGHA